jgi:hypothetical protein
MHIVDWLILGWHELFAYLPFLCLCCLLGLKPSLALDTLVPLGTSDVRMEYVSLVLAIRCILVCIVMLLAYLWCLLCLVVLCLGSGKNWVSPL